MDLINFVIVLIEISKYSLGSQIDSRSEKI